MSASQQFYVTMFTAVFKQAVAADLWRSGVHTLNAPHKITEQYEMERARITSEHALGTSI